MEISTLMISVLLVLLAVILLWPEIEIVWNGSAMGQGVGMSILGICLAETAPATVMGASELMRLPDPVLDIGAEGGAAGARIFDRTIIMCSMAGLFRP